jgi:hypothetical protein
LQVDGYQTGIVFVRDEREFSVFADGELFGIRAGVPAVDQLSRHRIDDTETISRLVCGRAIFIHAGRHPWGAAQCHENARSIRRGMNATGTLAH